MELEELAEPEWLIEESPIHDIPLEDPSWVDAVEI